MTTTATCAPGALSDSEIVEGLLRRDASLTKDFLYRRCYPLFKSIYDRYLTDCVSCFEFINEIYLLIMTPPKGSSVPRLASFTHRCSLAMWLKIVAQNYCRQIFAKKGEIIEESLPDGDRNADLAQSLSLTTRNIDFSDLARLIEAMPNKRYRQIIRLRYVDEKSNEETAAELQMTLPNFYNKHKLAKAQFCEQLRKEGLL